MDTYADTHDTSATRRYPVATRNPLVKLEAQLNTIVNRSEGFATRAGIHRGVLQEARETHTATAIRTRRFRPTCQRVRVPVTTVSGQEARAADSVISTLTLPLSTIGPRDSCRGITHTSAAETRTAWGDPVAPASIVRIGCIPLSTQDSLLTTNQTAHILSLSRSTICRLLKTGELPSITIGRTRRISRLDIDRYIEQQRKLHREKAVGF